MRWSSFKYLVRQGWHSMVANRLMTLASVGVLSACLFITGVALLLSLNVNSFVSGLSEQNEVEFFLTDETTADAAAQLQTQIAAMDNVAECLYISKSQAVEEMKVYLGDDAGVLKDYEGEGNPANPLPASFRVTVKDLAYLSDTVSQIQTLLGASVSSVQSPTELGTTLVNLQRVVGAVGWGLVIVLGVISIVVINNTIRLTVFARRKEINIMKFVGATNGFIRLPFFVEGMTVGAIAGLVASVLVGGGYLGLLKALAQPEASWLSEFTRCMLPFKTVMLPVAGLFVAFGMAIGSTGCATSIRKHLKV